MLPVLRTKLLEQAIKVADAGFGVIPLQVAAIAHRPSPLVGMMLSEAAEGWLHVGIGLSAVEEGQKPLDLVLGILPESSQRQEELVGGMSVRR